MVHLVALYSPKSVSLPSPIFGWDKLVHMSLFGVVLWLGVRAGLNRRILLAALVANAALSEIAQYLWLAKRSGDVFDTVADLLGLLIAIFVLRRGNHWQTSDSVTP